MGETVNYIRVSSIDQNPDRQVDGLPESDRQFIEKASGATVKRPVLQEMLRYIRKGDHVYVHSIDRLARNIIDLNNLAKQITDAGCAVTFVKENMTFGNGENSALSEMLFNVLGSFAQFERRLIKERQAEGIAAAKAKGKHLGRPSRLNERQKNEIIRKHQEGTTIARLSREYGISRGSVYNIIKPRRG